MIQASISAHSGMPKGYQVQYVSICRVQNMRYANM